MALVMNWDFFMGMDTEQISPRPKASFFSTVSVYFFIAVVSDTFTNTKRPAKRGGGERSTM